MTALATVSTPVSIVPTKMNYLEQISDSNALITAFKKSEKGCRWKCSVQKYELNLLQNTFSRQKEIRAGKYLQKPFVEFELRERGKIRPIKSMHISDRVVQRCVCDEALVPVLTKYLIYDNGASMKGKGISHARNRLKCHLEKYYRKFGNEGYILQIDFSKFFDNIEHEKLLCAMAEKMQDLELMDFVAQMIKYFEIDVSYLSEDEYTCCISQLYNSLEYRLIPEDLKTKERYMAKSVGIGSQISQISGIFFPRKIDDYCKTVKGLKYYGRYMDDIYIIHNDKAYLRDLLGELTDIATELGLHINHKKTQIVKLSHGFTFIGIKYLLTDTGRIVLRIKRESVTRERRKLKRYAHLLSEGKMTRKEIQNAYQSWRGNAKYFDSYKTIISMDKLYKQLFGGKK